MQHKIKILLLGLALISLLNISSSDKVDSLYHILQTATHDTTHAAILVALTEELAASNPDTVIPLCQQAIAIIEKHIPGGSEGTSKSTTVIPTRSARGEESPAIRQSLLKTKAVALNNIGAIYDNQGQIKEALEYYGRSLKIHEDIGDKQGTAGSLNNIGYIYNNQGQIKKALEYFGRSLKIREDIGDKHGIAISLNNIGYIYGNQGQIKEALEYYCRSLKIQEDIGDKQGIAYSLNNIGLIYNNQAEVLRMRKASPDSVERQIKEALEYFGRSLKIRKDIGDKQGIAMSLNNIGYIYKNQAEVLRKRGASPDSLGRQIKEALEYYGRSLKIWEDIEDKKGIAYSLNNIGTIYFQEKELAKAKDYADSSLKVAKELGYPENIYQAAKLNADIYKAGSNYKAGWEMYELYVLMRDSVKNKENEKAAIKQHTKYEFEKAMLVKEQEEEERSRQEAEAVSRRNMLQYSGILLTLVFMFMGIFLLARRLKKPVIAIPSTREKQSPDKNVFRRLLQSPSFRGRLFLLRNDVKIFEGTLFVSFLILFEFILVFLDPYLEKLITEISGHAGGEPAYKLLVNALLAGVIFPLHKILEAKLRASVIKSKVVSHKSEGGRQKQEENSGSNTLLLIVGFMFISLFNISFSDKVDSLKAELQKELHDTTKIKIRSEIGEEAMILRIGFWDTIRTDARKWNMQKFEAHALNNIGYIYMNQGQIKEALEYHGRSLKICEDIGDKKGIAISLNNIGLIYDNQGQIKEALEYYGRSLKIREDIGDKQGIANSLNNIAGIYDNQGQIKEALEYYGRSLKIREDIGDKQGIANSLNNIGYIYDNQGQIKEALEYHGRSLKIKEDIGDKQGIAMSLNNIGYIYNHQGQIKEALEYYGRSLKIREDIGEKQGIAMSLNNIGSIYNHQAEALRKWGASPDSIGRQIKEALEYFGRSLKIKEDIGDKKGITTSLNNIGGIYLKEKELAKAKEYVNSSLKIAKELGFPENIYKAAKLYAAVYKAGSNYKDGWDMYELYVVMHDSVKNKENEKAAIRQHTRFEFEKAMLVKEQEEKEKSRQEAEAVGRRNMLQYSSIFLMLIFLFGIVFFLARISIPEWMIELSTFVPFMILFEFTLVLIEPYIENYTQGEPVFNLLINVICAAIIFPIHSYFEKKLKKHINEIKLKKEKKFEEEFRKEVEKIG